MRAVSLLALCACTGGPVLSSSVAYMRTPLQTDKQTVQLCRNGSAVVSTDAFYLGSYELDGMVAAIMVSSVGADAREQVFHFDLATLSLRELPDPSPWVSDPDYAKTCDGPTLP